MLNCAPDGTPLTPPPSELLRGLGRAGARLPDWVLVDSAQVGGCGGGCVAGSGGLPAAGRRRSEAGRSKAGWSNGGARYGALRLP